MCPYCDYNSYKNMIFKDPLTNEWYLKVMGTGWDSYNDDWQHENVYYCPFCGRDLNEDESRQFKGERGEISPKYEFESHNRL